MVVKLEKLIKLVNRVKKSPAINNEFYDVWINRPLSIGELEIFARNHGEFVKSFPNNLAILISRTDNLDAKVQYVSTLYSELGNGYAGRAHSKLFDYFMSQLGYRLGEMNRLSKEKLKEHIKLADTTIQLIQGERELYGEKNIRIGVGAQLFLEFMAYHIQSKLNEGTMNYTPLWPSRESFDRDAEYFLIHLIAEKNHEQEALNAARQYVTNIKDFKKIEEGFKRHEQLFINYWKGICKAISKSKYKPS